MKESKFYQEIQEESRQQTGQIYVVEALEARFGKECANMFKPTIQTILNADELSELHRAAIKCQTVDGFRRLMKRMTKARTSQTR